MESLNKILDEGKEVIVGAGIGTAYGCTVAAISVAQSAAQICFYPVYMANCAVRPFVNLVVAPALPVICGALGGLTGLFVKLADK